ncbi:MAG: hypothetical protein HYY28_03615 [Betaproteobacteria bacterium]|nr:hypothetical protein [Betaproteobacteria bacterium]
MAKPNYEFEKRQKDLTRKKKQEDKRQRKLSRKRNQNAADPGKVPDGGGTAPE